MLRRLIACHRGQEMDFVRRVLLMLAISMLGVSSALATGVGATGDQVGPAPASTAPSEPTAAKFTTAEPLAQAQTSNTGPTYYGAPYSWDDTTYGTGGPFGSVSATVQAYFAWYEKFWGVSTGCSISVEAAGSGGPAGAVASMYERGSNCGGGPEYVVATASSSDPAKNMGNGCGSGGGQGGHPCPMLVGEPINAATGNEYLETGDYAGGRWLSLRRFYNSSGSVITSEMGLQWRHSFDRFLQLKGSPATAIVMVRPDGVEEGFAKSNNVWTTDPDVPDQLVETDNSQGVATSYTVFIAASHQYETYSATSGLLEEVTDQ